MTSLWDPNYVATSTSLKFLRKTHTVFYYVIRWQNKPYGIDQISSNEHRNKWHLMKENVFMKNQKKNHQLWNSYEWETLVTNVNFELKSDKWCIYVFFVPSSKGTMVIFLQFHSSRLLFASTGGKNKNCGHELTVIPTESEDITHPQ